MASKKCYTEFRKWYNSLSGDQRASVYKKADLSGIPAPDYEKATDDMLEWLRDESEYQFSKDLSSYEINSSTTVRAWSNFSKWYDSLTSKQRDIVDDIADEEGLPAYEECNDNELSWLKDESETAFKDSVGSTLVGGPIPSELKGLSWIASARSINPTFNDDLLRIAEEGYDAIKVRFDYVKDGKRIGSGWNFAFESTQDFDSFVKEIKSKRIPLVGQPRVLMSVDWNNVYNIQIDSYYDGTQTLQWHNVGTKVP